MKRALSLILTLCLLLALGACARPDDIQMDVAQGFGENTKLIHLNASSDQKRDRMIAVGNALVYSSPLEKDPAMFAYYPDYRVTLRGLRFTNTGDAEGFAPELGAEITAVVDINGDWVDLIFLGEPDVLAPGREKTPGVIYRSQVSAREFQALIHAG